MQYQQTLRATREEGGVELVKVCFAVGTVSAELLRQTSDAFSRLEPNFVAADLDGEQPAFWFSRSRLAFCVDDAELDTFGREMFDLIGEVMGAIAGRNG